MDGDGGARAPRSGRGQHERDHLLNDDIPNGDFGRSSWVDRILGGARPPGRGGKARRSIVLAPEHLRLPPRTELHGSSRIMANARNAELRISGRASLTAIPEAGGCGEDAEGGGAGDAFVLRTLSERADSASTLAEIEGEYLQKVKTTFFNDAVTFAEGTIPQSMMVALVIGTVCGVVAYLYYTLLEFSLELVWKDLPERFVVGRWPEHLHFLWIPLVTFTMSTCCGLSIYFLGEPGDMAYTIKCVHDKGYKGTHHIIPMVAASLFTILAGASMGPEAPLVAICAATAGFLSRKVFRQQSRNVVRKHTIMGMAGALSAFFGAPLGGSIFALEVTSRFGIEYFEHLVEAIFAGEVCVVVFRSIAGLPLGPIWEITPVTPSLRETRPSQIVWGAAIGLLGAGVAYVWASLHWRLMGAFRGAGLMDDDNRYAVARILPAAAAVALIGVLVPHTMFFSERETGTIASMSPASDLPNVWPTSGLLGFEMDSPGACVAVGLAKLLAVSFTFAGGYRGGYIFPFFAAGAALGRALCFAFPGLSPVVATLCFGASINVAITRTALASALVSAFLSGEQMALPAVLAASVVSLFLTGYMPFIKTQIARSDIDFSLFHKDRAPEIRESVRH